VARKYYHLIILLTNVVIVVDAALSVAYVSTFLSRHILSNWFADSITMCIGFDMGILQVMFSHTTLLLVYTIPIPGTGTYRPTKLTVCHETCGTFGTRGFLSLRYC
jgi:hypothetical protein